MFDFVMSWRYIYRYNISVSTSIYKYILEMKKKKM